jgi:hypothetical protein
MAIFDLTKCSDEQLDGLSMFLQQAIGPESAEVMELRCPKEVVFKSLIPAQSLAADIRPFRTVAIRFLMNRMTSGQF